MILKSLARKKPSFKQLYGYLTREAENDFTISHNLYYVQDEKEILRQFLENAELLKERKGGNYLYHEILSLKLNSELSLEYVKEALYELSNLYVQERAKNNLCYGRLHVESHHVHVHFMLSSNELGNEHRLRLEKQKFLELQKNLERYLLERYPKLEQEQVYTKEREYRREHVQDREFQMKSRTGKLSQRENVKELLEMLFTHAQTQDEFLEYCTKYKIAFYQRGKNVGIQLDGRNYRLNKLELEEPYRIFVDKIQRQKKLEEARVREQEYTQESENKEHFKSQEQEQKEKPEYVKTRMEELEKIRQEQERLRQKELELEKELEDIQKETDPQDVVSKRLQELNRLREQQHQYEQEHNREQ